MEDGAHSGGECFALALREWPPLVHIWLAAPEVSLLRRVCEKVNRSHIVLHTYIHNPVGLFQSVISSHSCVLCVIDFEEFEDEKESLRRDSASRGALPRGDCRHYMNISLVGTACPVITSTTALKL